jgi:hypothetical protein
MRQVYAHGNLKFNDVINEREFKSRPEILSQQLHIALTAIGTVHIGKGTQ